MHFFFFPSKNLSLFTVRKAALEKNGSIIQNSVHSSDSWMRTIFVIRVSDKTLTNESFFFLPSFVAKLYLTIQIGNVRSGHLTNSFFLG
jgi:hypothetical protein